MENYVLFLLLAITTVLSPGPGVVLTLKNSISYGLPSVIDGILGFVVGTFVVAFISVTSIGVVLATSPLAFFIMKILGAAYLAYLGVKLWFSPAVKLTLENGRNKAKKVQFIEGLTLQLTNPKAVMFFMSVFPQFIDRTSNYKNQFLLLAVTYSILIVIIHLIYACLAKTAHAWLSSDTGSLIINRIGGVAFICFGAALTMANNS